MVRGSFKKSRGRVNNYKNQRFNPKHNQKSIKKRRFNKNDQLDDGNAEKRAKFEIRPQKPIASSSESEEEEIENPLHQLLNTFGENLTNAPVTSIDTDDEISEDELDENTENEDDENLGKELEESEDDVLNESEEFDDTDSNEDKSINEEINNDINEELKEIEENEIDPEDEADTNSSKDSFVQHLFYDLSDELLDSLQNAHKKEVHNIDWPVLGKLNVVIPICRQETSKKTSFTIEEDKKYAPLGQIPTRLLKNTINFSDLCIKSQIHNNIQSANSFSLKETNVGPFTELQLELFSVINNYQDMYFNERTIENGEEVRFIYCLHSINHVLKTRTKVLHHNAKLLKKDDVPDEFRDQGLVRPKVLIIVPFRDSAFKVIKNLIALLVPSEAGQVINKKRFVEEFSGNELFLPKRNPKPEDYEKTFTGNCDDTFKIGIQVTKKSLKLYSDFYSSDIIIASPLGLRLTVGADGEEERDYDFLASIELLILDQTELFLMQNWDHLLHVLDHLHIQPKQSHGTDFSRIRNWALNGLNRYYRQTLIFSSFSLPEINAIFNRRCANFSGSVRTVNTIKDGSIVNVIVQVPQIYKRFEADSVMRAIDARFEIFVKKILPQYKDTIMKQCLIYVPSYFDYVKIRNYFKREDISFVQICEYSKDGKIARARDMFFHGDAHFLLYSERFHYFRRIRIKGIRHIIFYQPPTFPHFYSEMCNFMQEANQNKKCGSMSNMTVSIIYSKYDFLQMASILGTERLSKMAASTNHFHMFTSSDT